MHRSSQLRLLAALAFALLPPLSGAVARDCSEPAFHGAGITIDTLLNRLNNCHSGATRGGLWVNPGQVPAGVQPQPAPGRQPEAQRPVMLPGQSPLPATFPATGSRDFPPHAPLPGTAACLQAPASRLQSAAPEGETRDAMPFVFALGDARLPPAAIPSLTDIANFLRAHPEVRITLVGHADATGTDAVNDQLSTMRAFGAAEYVARLVPDAVIGGRLAAMGAGARELRREVPPCDARQRRLEVRLRRQ